MNKKEPLRGERQHKRLEFGPVRGSSRSVGYKILAAAKADAYTVVMAYTNNITCPPSVNSSAMAELGLSPQQENQLLLSVARAEEQYKAGEAVPGAEVLAWIRSWGSDNPLPPPAIPGT